MQEQLQQAVAARLQAQVARPEQQGSPREVVQREWAACKEGILAAAKSVVPQRRKLASKPWISDPTRELSTQKRTAYDLLHALQHSGEASAEDLVAAKSGYRQLVRSTRCSAAADKDAQLQQQAADIEDLMRKGRISQAYRSMDRLTGRNTRPPVMAVSNSSGITRYGADAAPVLAAHFQQVLCVPTAIRPDLLAALDLADPTAPLERRMCALVTCTAEGMSEQQRTDIQAAAQGGRPPSPPPSPTASPRTRSQHARAQTASQQQQEYLQREAATAAAPPSESVPTLEEVEAAIQSLRNTAPGQDTIAAPVLKLSGAAAWIHRVIQAAWEGGCLPHEWKQSVLVPLWKGKGSRMQPSNYRGISLLDTAGKAFVMLILRRIRDDLLQQLHESQCGFRPERGTADQLFSLRILSELSRQYQVPLHAAFIDLSKAFDSINRDALWRLLRARGVNSTLLALIQDLYSGSEAGVTVDGSAPSWFPTDTGVRQGCPLSPLLFNVYLDFVARLVITECAAQGISGFTVAFRINGRLVTPPDDCSELLQLLMLLYADDMVLFAPDATALQAALLIFERVACDWGLTVNYGKTKVMVVGEQPLPSPAQQQQQSQQQQEQPQQTAQRQPTQQQQQQEQSMQLQGGAVAYVRDFTYLGCVTEADGSQERELSRRMATAAFAYRQLHKRVFRSSRVRLCTKMRLYKTVVLPALLYGAAETWALTRAQLHRLDVFNTTRLRWILGISRLDCVSNEQLYERTGQPAISTVLRATRLRWLGHLARREESRTVKQLLFAHFVPGGRSRQGGPRKAWHDMARADLKARDCDQSQWYDKAQDRGVWLDIVNG
jgi:hypothetical protein